MECRLRSGRWRSPCCATAAATAREQKCCAKKGPCRLDVGACVTSATGHRLASWIRGSVLACGFAWSRSSPRWACRLRPPSPAFIRDRGYAASRCRVPRGRRAAAAQVVPGGNGQPGSGKPARWSRREALNRVAAASDGAAHSHAEVIDSWRTSVPAISAPALPELPINCPSTRSNQPVSATCWRRNV